MLRRLRTMRFACSLGVLGAMCVAALGCAGGGAAGTVTASAPAAAASTNATCARDRSDVAAPGPYRVGTASITLSRRSATSGQTRAIDPIAWFPAGAPSRCRFALIVFSHGANGRATDYSRLLIHLASEGFIVLAPHHPDRAARGDEGQDRTDDVTFLLDRLTTVLDRLSPGLSARVERSRIGIAGHSFGGFTAAHLAATDPRIRAALVMAGGEHDSGAAAATRAPVLAMAGGADHLVPAAQVAAYVRQLPATTPHGFLEIGRAGHGAYGNGCAGPKTCGIVASYATSFFLTYLDGVKSAGRLLDSRALRDKRLSLTAVDMPPR